MTWQRPGRERRLTRSSWVLLLLSAVAFGCRTEHLSRRDLVGRYDIPSDQSDFTLVLESNGSFLEVVPDWPARTGEWSFDERTQRLRLQNVVRFEPSCPYFFDPLEPMTLSADVTKHRGSVQFSFSTECNDVVAKRPAEPAQR